MGHSKVGGQVDRRQQQLLLAALNAWDRALRSRRMRLLAHWWPAWARPHMGPRQDWVLTITCGRNDTGRPRRGGMSAAACAPHTCTSNYPPRGAGHPEARGIRPCRAGAAASPDETAGSRARNGKL